MTMRIFTEPTKDVVAHTGASKLMRDLNSLAWLEEGGLATRFGATISAIPALDPSHNQ